MAESPAQSDPKQRNLEAELDALLTQIQKDIPDISKDAPPAPLPSSSPAASKSSLAPSTAADDKKKPAANADLVDEQLAAQIQAMLDDASAQLSQGKTPAQITEETLARQLPPEPPPSPPSPLSPSAPPPSSSSALTGAAANVERIDAPLPDAPSHLEDHRQVAWPPAEPTVSAQEVSLESLDEDLAQKANIEISGEFAPVHEVIQETASSAAAGQENEPPASTGEKVSADDIDALIAQAVAEASPSSSPASASSLGAKPDDPEPTDGQGTAQQVASELDDQLAASADVQAVDGDFESVHEIPPSPPSAPSPSSAAIAASASASPGTVASATTATKNQPPKAKPAKPEKAPKPAGPSRVSILFKPVYGILTLINAPLAGLSPSARNLVGFIGLLTLLNAIALIAWKLSTASTHVGH